jgi:hypothetical protein
MKNNFLKITEIYNKLFWIYIDRKKEKFRVWQKARQRNKMIREADLRHKSDGKRYYVLPDATGKLHALNNREIEHLKKIGIMGKHVNINHLLKESVYHTK